MPQPKRPQKKAPKKPRPSQPPQPPAAAAPPADSSTASEKGSPETEAPAPDFVAEPGPAFDPGAEAPPAEAAPGGDLHALPELPPEWDEEVLRTLLEAKGELLHSAIGVTSDDWRYTQADLAAITPPLARILNRYPATRAAAGMGDPMALTIAMSAYGIRSARERAVAFREAEEEAEADTGGVTGTPAAPGTEPPPGHPAAAAPAPPVPAAPAPPAPAPLTPSPPIADPAAVEWQR